MHPTFAQYAMALPLEDRYTATLQNAYHRRKALILRLYPDKARRVLPSTKQLFSRSFDTYQKRLLSAERCVKYGLIDEQCLNQCNNTAILGMIQAVEQWIVGAEEAGATMSS